jgi:hypothetical protein
MNTNTQNTSNTLNKGLVTLVILFLFTSAGMFGQTKEVTTVQPVTPTIEVAIESNQMIALDSNAEFMSWFMGSNQTQSLKVSNDNEASSTISRKKQIILSGITPNKVLYRTLVKKVISQENAIV